MAKLSSFAATTSTGQTITRNSANAYTHCIVFITQDGKWMLPRWASSLPLAQKAARVMEGQTTETFTMRTSRGLKTARREPGGTVGAKVEIIPAVQVEA